MKNNIKIEVDVTYLQEQSNPLKEQYAYAYTITISNRDNTGVQLLTRHWKIQDETGHTENVIGVGVVGKQPHLTPKEVFQYSSTAVIKTPTGTMKGTYGMVDDNGVQFEVVIPEFILNEPYTLH